MKKCTSDVLFTNVIFCSTLTFVKAIADISWWKIKKNKSWATGKESVLHLTVKTVTNALLENKIFA